MKVCPNCRQNYEDDVEACPDDGTELIPAPEDLPENPEIREVLQVSPDEHTAMIDVDAIEAERERRGIERPEPEPEPESEGEDDPEATGTLNIDQLKQRQADQAEPTSANAMTTEVGALDVDTSKTMEVSQPDLDVERTQITRQRTRARPKKSDKKSGKRGVVIAAILGASLLLAAGLLGGAFYLFGAGKRAVLTVTTIPPGAKVLLDGEEIGTSPLQEKVKVGSHVLELTRPGNEPFKEVIDVPVEGLPFMQPLEPDPDYTPPAGDGGPAAQKKDAGPAGAQAPVGGDTPSSEDDGGPEPVPAASADEMVAAFVALLAEKKLDDAFTALKGFVRTYPDDKRSDVLFDQLAAARMKGKTRPTSGGSGRKVSAKNKKQRAREAYAEGEMLYRERSYGEAKLRFQSSVQLDPRFSRPHRALARIYQREDNVGRARYHLERYLGLGGADPDYKVRRWLEEHPRQ